MVGVWWYLLFFVFCVWSILCISRKSVIDKPGMMESNLHSIDFSLFYQICCNLWQTFQWNILGSLQINSTGKDIDNQKNSFVSPTLEIHIITFRCCYKFFTMLRSRRGEKMEGDGRGPRTTDKTWSYRPPALIEWSRRLQLKMQVSELDQGKEAIYCKGGALLLSNQLP